MILLVSNGGPVADCQAVVAAAKLTKRHFRKVRRLAADERRAAEAPVAAGTAAAAD